MDWTWRLDGVVGLVLVLQGLAGGLVTTTLLVAGFAWVVRARWGRQLLLVLVASATAGALPLGRPWVIGFRLAALLGGLALACVGVGAVLRARVRSHGARAAIAAWLLLAWDAVYVLPGSVTLLALAAGCVYVSGALVAAALRARAASPRDRLAAAVLWLFATVGTILAGDFNLRLAEQRGQAVVAACESYRREHGTLPKTLDVLVPRYLPRVPHATWTAVGGYFYDPERGELSHLQHGRYLRIYDFKARDWHVTRTN
jgi:hypothetical protein